METLTEEANGDDESNLDRRTVLKGTAAAGLAGSGFTGNASASGYDEITFCAAGRDLFSYLVSVTGEVKRGGQFESDRGDEILDRNSARGAVSEGRCDSWLFKGDLTELKLEGPGKVFVNGELFEDTTKRERLPHKLTVRGRGKDPSYKVEVSGRIRKGPKSGDTDRIVDGNVVRGRVGTGEEDDFFFSGSIVLFENDDPVTMTVDFNVR